MTTIQFIIFAILISLVFSCTNDHPISVDADYTKDKSPIGCEIGSTAPNFVTELIDGQRFELKKFRSKIVMIEFWATWCPYCINSVPVIKAVQKQFKDNDNFALLGVSINDENEKLINFINEKEMSWLHTENGKLNLDLKTLFCISGIPTVILIDKYGVIRYKINPTESKTLTNKIELLLEE